MSNYLRVYEVGPRDGLQNEATHVPTKQKLDLIDALVEARLPTIEVTSFVHPKAVPQMADADDVMAASLSAHQEEPVTFTGLVLNEKGYERAFAAGCRHMALGVAVSESFSQRNVRMSTEKAFEVAALLAERARREGVWIRAYLMTAWVCPFEGTITPQKATAYARRLWEMGVDELVIADTVGYANPLDVGLLLEMIGRSTKMEKLAVHLHDTQALGLANMTAALQAGVRIADSSVGGLGGCPFAPGAAGNLATEDLVFLAYKLGLGTGVDFQKLWEAVRVAEAFVGRPIGGRIRAWWESRTDEEPMISIV